MSRLTRLLPLAIAVLGVSGAWFFSHSFSAAAQTVPASVAIPETDSDGDGLSDYAERHKYFTDPHKARSAGSSVMLRAGLSGRNAGHVDGFWLRVSVAPGR